MGLTGRDARRVARLFRSGFCGRSGQEARGSVGGWFAQGRSIASRCRGRREGEGGKGRTGVHILQLKMHWSQLTPTPGLACPCFVHVHLDLVSLHCLQAILRILSCTHGWPRSTQRVHGRTLSQLFFAALQPAHAIFCTVAGNACAICGACASRACGGEKHRDARSRRRQAWRSSRWRRVGAGCRRGAGGGVCSCPAHHSAHDGLGPKP